MKVAVIWAMLYVVSVLIAYGVWEAIEKPSFPNLAFVCVNITTFVLLAIVYAQTD